MSFGDNPSGDRTLSAPGSVGESFGSLVHRVVVASELT
jgi:hypothetical protein